MIDDQARQARFEGAHATRILLMVQLARVRAGEITIDTLESIAESMMIGLQDFLATYCPEIASVEPTPCGWALSFSSRHPAEARREDAAP